MENIITWVTENWGSISTGILVLTLLFSLIVKFTPTPKDDTALDWIINLLDRFSWAQTEKNKAILDAAKNNQSKK